MKNKKPKIKAIIFDVGGVLTSTRGKFVSDYMSKKINIRTKSLIKKMKPEHLLLNKGKISEKIALKKIANKLGTDKKTFKKIWIEAYKTTHEKNLVMINFTRKLKKNYKIAILSNQNSVYSKVIKKFNFYKIFNPVVLSYKIKTRKPEPKIYKITLKKLKLKPRECIFIDNLKRNLIPARKIGMKTILFKNINQLKKDLKKKGVVW